jgi:capsular exopolysaccharide synthesis family protein
VYKKKKRRLQTSSRKLVALFNPTSMISEQFRTIRTNIKFAMPNKNVQTILFTSASPGDGKTTTAANVAIVYAQEGKKVLIVDGDMRKPSMHYSFHTTNSPGLSNLLSRQWSIEDVVKETGIKGVHLIPCGQIPSNPAELLSSSILDSVLAEMKNKYEVVIFDAPPLLAVTDAQILANKCDGTILVINTGKTTKESLARAIDSLQIAKATILGTILNNYKLKKDRYIYRYYSLAD